MIDAGLLIFPLPECMHLSSAQLKVVRDPPLSKGEDVMNDLQFLINS